MFAVNLPQR